MTLGRLSVSMRLLVAVLLAFACVTCVARAPEASLGAARIHPAIRALQKTHGGDALQPVVAADGVAVPGTSLASISSASTAESESSLSLAVHLTADTVFGFGYEAARQAGTAVHQDMLRYCANQVTLPGPALGVSPLFAAWRSRNNGFAPGPLRAGQLAANAVTAADITAYLGAPAAPIPHNTGANVALGTFRLSLDAVSRVRFAGGWVQNVGAATAAGNAPSRFTAMTYAAALGVAMPVATGHGGVQVYNDFDIGHIVASTLCGAICNTSPLNFFPQRRDSNSASNWYWAELFAQNLRARLLGGKTADSTIRIEITLDYPTARWLIPDSGEYRVIWRPDNVQAANALVGGNQAIQNLAATPASIRTYINNAVRETSNPLFWRVVFPWTNPVRNAAQIVVP